MPARRVEKLVSPSDEGRGRVLGKKPGDKGWKYAEYDMDLKEGFDFKALQKMVGNSIFASLRLDEDFVLICDENGSLNGSKPNVGLANQNGEVLTLVGPIAVVRVTRKGAFVGLLPGDGELIGETFDWRAL
ncbi:DUF3846 domain-containing protein [Acidisphaera sp. L21]|uniref:DUF3846 domain-containing protein n=1 Tax=Acidisphaera sp. L21 TaxID=1641851 RepID=UPI00131BA5BA|nr:DUF3846 domain-containing protein [Acidisphaera sp. L21]